MSARIVFVDDSEDLRTLLVKVFSSRYNESCAAYASLRDVELHKEEVLSSDVVVLDVNLGPDQPDGIAVYNWLQEQKFYGNVVFLTGHARSHTQVQKACSLGSRVWEKPVNVSKFVKEQTKLTHTR